MFKYLSIIIFLLLINGCIASSADVYIVYVDEKFDNFEQNKIKNALDEWTLFSKNEVKFVIKSLSEAPQIPGDHEIYLLYSNSLTANSMCHDDDGGTVGCTYRDDLHDTSFTYFAVYDIENDPAKYVKFRHIIEHEVGHALGIGHLPKGNMMAPNVSEISDHLTCNDIRALYSNRGSTQYCDLSNF